MAIQPLAFGQHYHIYNRGNNRENIFVEPRNYPYFLKQYAKHILPIAETFAYCLMPNHFHFSIRTRTEEEQEAYWRQTTQSRPISKNGALFKLQQPSRAFNNFFIAYARAFNKATDRTGALFERPFGRKLVTSDAYFRTLLVYIHQNPQKHGFVDDYRTWRWSSYSTFHSQQVTQLARASVIEWFGDVSGFDEAHLVSADEQHINFLIEDDNF